MSGAAHKSPTVAQELLALGAPADVASAGDGRTPLWEASAAGNAEVVRLLLAAGADPSVQAAAASRSLTAVEVAKAEKEMWAHIRQTTPQVLSVIGRPFDQDFDAVVSLLEQAISERPAR